MTTTCFSGFLSLLHILLNNFFVVALVLSEVLSPLFFSPPLWAKEAKPVFSHSAFGTRADSSWHLCVFFCFCRERYSESACLCRFFSCWICVDLALSEVYHTAILCLFWKRLSGDNVSYYIRNCVRVYVCVQLVFALWMWVESSLWPDSFTAVWWSITEADVSHRD